MESKKPCNERFEGAKSKKVAIKPKKTTDKYNPIKKNFINFSKRFKSPNVLINKLVVPPEL